MEKFPFLITRNIAGLALLMSFFNACSSANSQTMESKNELHSETSPYLLQHADNPVHWKPWGEKALQTAQDSNKLIIISIGYSACHWCHVMEHECFEDTAVAELMNAHYVSIKVDREERPDVDEVYMTAVQLMRQQGGWPLNVVALPDGSPVWGGTYLPKPNWMKALRDLAQMWKQEPEKMREYAARLSEGVQQAGLVQIPEESSPINPGQLESMMQQWRQDFDQREGGTQRVPKFPLPINYRYLLQHGSLSANEEVLSQVQLTLQKMAWGGIYDQVGGGFARYSTDGEWVVPHFEKMLYDNAQMLSLYSEGYRQWEKPLYRNIVYHTIQWLESEMTGEHHEFYSALDADSEGEEGKYYVWTEEELKGLIPGDDWVAFTNFYDLKKGRWEDNIILVRTGMNAPQKQVARWRSILANERAKRVRPGLDNKALTSWNALTISGLCQAYRTFKEPNWLEMAQKNAQWILNLQAQADNRLYHSFKEGKSSVNGLIEDYAFAAQAFLDLYEITGQENYLTQAQAWINFADAHFKTDSGVFYYTRDLGEKELFARNQEVSDNVIPAANSVMAHNLFRLGHYQGKEQYHQKAQKMLGSLTDQMENHPTGFSNWLRLLHYELYPFYEVATLGANAPEKQAQLTEQYLPNVLFTHSTQPSDKPLLKERFSKDGTYIYVCQNRVCKRPVQEPAEALKLMHKENGE